MCNQDEPYLITSDVTVPTLTISASDDNWHSTISTGGLANGDRITFKFTLSEPLIKTTGTEALLLPGGGTADGDVTTSHKCANPVSWGTVRPPDSPSCCPPWTHGCLLRVCRRGPCTTFDATPSRKGG